MLNEEQRFPYPEMRRYIEYLVTYRTKSRNTATRTTYCLSILGRDLQGRHGLQRFPDVTQAMLLDCVEHYAIGRSKGTVSTWRQTVEGFLTWCCKEQILQDGMNMLPEPTMSDVVTETMPSILMPETIFRMRMITGINLRAAMSFELLLSSGVRWSEFVEIRPCDISFEHVPLDVSTGKQSLYVGGQFPIKSDRQAVKNNRSRMGLFSKIAARLIRMHVQHVGLDMTSRAPLYPYPRKTFDQDMEELKKMFPELRGSQLRKRSMNDTRIEDFGLTGSEDEEFRKQLENKIKRDNTFLGPKDPYADREVIEKVRGIHPHKMRHSFACFQYYRNYYGTQHDMVRVQQMMGHGSSNAIYTYLSQINAIRSEIDWRKLWIGIPGDWRRLT